MSMLRCCEGLGEAGVVGYLEWVMGTLADIE